VAISSIWASDWPTSSRPAITTPRGSKDAETSQRDFLRFQDDRHQTRADLDIGGRRGRARWKRIGPSPKQIGTGGEIERRPDRRQFVFAIGPRLRWNFSAKSNPGAEAGFHFARIDRGEHAALSDQFGLGLMNKLVVIEAEEEQPDQWQCRRRGERGKNDLPHRRSPFFTRVGHHACGSHRPSLKPTP